MKGAKMHAEVIINSNAKALNKVFDYKVPSDMENNIHIGSRVFVPFGRGSKLEDGFVISLKENFIVKRICSIHYFEYTKNFMFSGESHDFWEFVYLDKGEYYIIIGQQKETIEVI